MEGNPGRMSRIPRGPACVLSRDATSGCGWGQEAVLLAVFFHFPKRGSDGIAGVCAPDRQAFQPAAELCSQPCGNGGALWLRLPLWLAAEAEAAVPPHTRGPLCHPSRMCVYPGLGHLLHRGAGGMGGWWPPQGCADSPESLTTTEAEPDSRVLGFLAMQV